jgi:alpha-glucosidase
MWSDIDIYHAYRDFTLDPVSYPPDQLKALIQDLHNNGQHCTHHFHVLLP